jgi:uncharacterized delta-60 repeat protein
MKATLYRNFVILVFVLLLPFVGFAQRAGDLDRSFNYGNDINYQFIYGTKVYGSIRSICLQPNGKIIIGGDFTSVNDILRNRIARLNRDGSLDANFNPGTGADYTIYSISLQPDGKIIIGGNFSKYNGISKKCIARLNTDGSLDESFNTLDESFNSLNGYIYSVHAICLQPDGKIIVGGNFATFNGSRRSNILRLNTDGSIDESFNPIYGASSVINSVILLKNGKIIIAGLFMSYDGVEVNRIACLNKDGSLDIKFKSGKGANGDINCTYLQPDGKIIIGGRFTSFDGASKNRIARLNKDGSIDTGFIPDNGPERNDGDNAEVKSIDLQPDGKIIIGGFFTSYKGTECYGVARLNPDASLDTTFIPETKLNSTVYSISVLSNKKIVIGGIIKIGYDSNHGIGRLNSCGGIGNIEVGANNTIKTTVLQPDGKILIGGNFTLYNGIKINRIARLNSDGSLDKTFKCGTGANDCVRTIALQNDGKIVIGGSFSTYNEINTVSLARLNADGSFDENFKSKIGENLEVNCVLVQPDGKYFVGGFFNNKIGSSKNCITRLNPDGTLDKDFKIGLGIEGNDSVPPTVISAILQPNGKIIIGGGFNYYNGIKSNGIVRLNSNGSLDLSFKTGSGIGGVMPYVFSLALQSNGKIIIGGSFHSFNNIPRNYIARLDSNGSIDYGFNSRELYSSVQSIKFLANEKIVIGCDGGFVSGKGIFCLKMNGTIDNNFDPGIGVVGSVLSTIVQPNGKIIIAGSFIRYSNIETPYITRIHW